MIHLKPEHHSPKAAEIFAPIGATHPAFFFTATGKTQLTQEVAQFPVKLMRNGKTVSKQIVPVMATFVNNGHRVHPLCMIGLN